MIKEYCRSHRYDHDSCIRLWLRLVGSNIPNKTLTTISVSPYPTVINPANYQMNPKSSMYVYEVQDKILCIVCLECRLCTYNMWAIFGFSWVNVVLCIKTSELEINDYSEEYYKLFAYRSHIVILYILLQMKTNLLYCHWNPQSISVQISS